MHCPQPFTYVIRQGDNLYQLARYYQTTVSDILAMNPGADPYNLQIGSMLTICPGEEFRIIPDNQTPAAYPDPVKQISLINDMRLKWSQHVYWTRMLLISIAERLHDLNAVTSRLMQNPDDIAGVFARYYSPETAGTIARLLSEHLQIGAKLITALRDGNTATADELNRQWYINADKMADAFSSINPYYDRQAMREMLHRHLALTTQEVAMRLAADYPADIKAFDAVEEEALKMADEFSYGIMMQFPQMFS
ncbi:MAG: LysM domain-containing protein [Oscillospiraceae bacterium]|nr:LysM domain-containing protein [Oscillospiraceae bacterium]